MTKNGKHENSSPAAGTPERKLLCRGLAASPGLAAGKVVLVPGSADAVKITDGDILVTTMTTPDMIPALRKAGAVVTDEGAAHATPPYSPGSWEYPASWAPGTPRRSSPKDRT